MTSGNQGRESIKIYPDDCLQNAILPDPWWVLDKEKSYRFGRLVKAFLPHVDQDPITAIPKGRQLPTEHNIATIKFVPLNIRKYIRYPKLPVAGIPQFPNEVRAVYRAKKRPAVIICSGGDRVTDWLTRDKSKWQTMRTVLVAPYYGGKEGWKRAGYSPAFAERVRRCEYPQFVWDWLPFENNDNIGSLLRLDHIQPVGRSQNALEITDYCLSDTAIDFLKDWLYWIFKERFHEDSFLYSYREEFFKVPYQYPAPD